jgi:hypothetical protein
LQQGWLNPVRRIKQARDKTFAVLTANPIESLLVKGELLLRGAFAQSCASISPTPLLITSNEPDLRQGKASFSYFATMSQNPKDPNFLVDHQSVASLVAQLHEYFKDSQSHYEIERSHLVSRLDAASDEEAQKLSVQIRKLDAEISLFGVLRDSLSIADRVLHTRSVMNELGLDNKVYKMHDEAVAKQI